MIKNVTEKTCEMNPYHLKVAQVNNFHPIESHQLSMLTASTRTDLTKQLYFVILRFMTHFTIVMTTQALKDWPIQFGFFTIDVQYCGLIY